MTPTKELKSTAFVLGAGAGGIGCVYSLVRNGINTVVADINPDFGGTMVFGGVDGWEPGVSLDGLHKILADELCKMPNGGHVTEVVPNCNLFSPDNGWNWDNHSFSKYPWGLCMPTGRTYEETLGRCTSIRGENGTMKRFQFDGRLMPKAVHNVLAPYEKHLTTLFGYAFSDCEVKDGRLVSVTVSNKSESVKIYADYFVDCSGDIVLARAAGCEYAFGCEGKEAYNEPCARDASDNVNAVSYVFRVTPKEQRGVDEIPCEYEISDIEKWKSERMKKTVTFMCKYPNGDLSLNMLPTMEGKEYFALGERADLIGKARVYAYWQYLQAEKGLDIYRLSEIYSAGIRESYRLVGRYVLTETDVRAGKPQGIQNARVAAIADHALDVHGEGGMCRELEFPYEIPLECCMAKEYGNLFVACRGASFSHIASASTRLSRTMMSLGESVGKHICGMHNS
ncbi:MAG: FAD-dependent oxidoreductase [Clostridia bacterium]|nr:FAD-dependent oxidoreductase [Clostridia bacterium]